MPEAPLRLVVAEDEPLNRKRIVRMLREAGCEVAAELPDGLAVVEWLEAGGQADGFLLDIEMPGATGLEVARVLPRRAPVVFVTAHPQHGPEAFDAEAVDYLMKPITPERLSRALDRMRERLAGRPPARAAGPIRYPVRAGEGLLLMDLARTSHFLLENETVWAFVAGERHRTTWKSLAETAAAFPPGALIRGHRNLLLRPESVLGVRAGRFGRMRVWVNGGLELDVSRSTAKRLRERLGLERPHRETRDEP